MHTDIYERITQRIIDQLQNGVVAWRRPWRRARRQPRQPQTVQRGERAFLATARPMPLDTG